jgi:hypothetical protein
VLAPFQLAQLAFAAFVIAVIAERVYYLYVRAPASEAAVRWLVRAIEAGDLEVINLWSRARPESHAGRLVTVHFAGGELEDDALLLDLNDAATARLFFIRVSATLASTTGLLGGILALARGESGSGLAALAMGGAERQNLDEALATMAIGVALSALCFQALALLRPAAQKLVAQTAQVARALRAHASRSGAAIPPLEAG